MASLKTKSLLFSIFDDLCPQKSDLSPTESDEVNRKTDRTTTSTANRQTYVPPHKQQNGLSTVKEREKPLEHSQSPPSDDPKDKTNSKHSDAEKVSKPDSHKDRPQSIDLQKSPNKQNFSQKSNYIFY